MINNFLAYDRNGLKFYTKRLVEKKNHTLIKIKSCGICGSDIKIIQGKNRRVKKGRIIGHEISGQICTFDRGKIKITNRKIFLGADIPNQKKKNFALGHEIDGGFQSYLHLKNSLLKIIPHKITKKKIDFNLASLCEPLACVLNGFEKINYEGKGDILIYGNGPVGNLIAAVGLYFGCKRIIIVDNKLKRTRYGIKNKFLKRLTVHKLKKLKNFKYGFLACNSAEAQNDILKFIDHGGTINYFAGLSYGNNFPKINTNLIHYNELKIIGSHGSKKKHIIKAANLIISKKINLQNIITHVFRLSDFKKAFQTAKNQEGLKIIIKP